jgi:hypothetical protein
MVSEDNGHTVSDKRRRVYRRKFDWLEVRSRHKAGEPMRAIARSLGVCREAVRRVIRMPEAQVRAATAEQVEALARMPRDRIPCPECGGPMTPYAERCWNCHAADMLAPMEVEWSPAIPRIELRNLHPGRIVDVDGRPGVLVSQRVPSMPTHRVVDFWDGGLELVHGRTVVRAERTSRVYVLGERQDEEAIEL